MFEIIDDNRTVGLFGFFQAFLVQKNRIFLPRVPELATLEALICVFTTIKVSQ